MSEDDNERNVNGEIVSYSGVDSESCLAAPSSCFFPRKAFAENPDYKKFLGKREKLLEIIRRESPAKQELVDDIVDSLLEADIPTGIVSGIKTFVGLTKKVRNKQQQREAYRKVVSSLLEVIFDPSLDFRMTCKEIKDVLEYHNFDRDKITQSHIKNIYVKVIYSLKMGSLRDLIFKEGLIDYVHLKLEHIRYSEQDWELNGR